jgi:tRNA dimethylallyltransferase
MTKAAGASVFVICGPTASGKSSLALALGERIGGAVINTDSMQVYRGLEILTAQPNVSARIRAPHLLYGVLEPVDPCSAGRWREMALDAINEAQGAGRVPILCGGTGLYLKALMEGIAPVPEIPDDLRARLRARHAEIGNAAFHAELSARDPDNRVRPSDPSRMLRAMEVLEATGKPLSYWQAQLPDGPPDGMTFCSVLLDPPRADLYAAIEARFDTMINAGAVAEARALADLPSDLPAARALGLRELIRAAAGELSLEDAVMQGKTRSRNYAKRQVTWFRSQIITNYKYEAKFSESLSEKILSEIL